MKDSCLGGRLFDQLWDGIILGKGSEYFILIIDWQGEIAHVIGKLCINSGWVNNLGYLSPTRRMIQLG